MVYVKKTAAARLALPAVTGCLLFLLALRPQQYSAVCMQGITLWAGAVLPALFPYFALTSMLTRMGAADKLSARLSPAARKVKLPGCAAYCFLLSVLSGYPVGARTIADLQAQGALDSKAAARVSLLCSTSGPMFLLGSVGGAMFKDMRAGGILLASHLLGVLIVYLVLLPFLPRLPETPALQSTPREEDVFGKSVQGAIFSILTVGGCIALFSVLGRAADDLHATAPPSAPSFLRCWEMRAPMRSPQVSWRRPAAAPFSLRAEVPSLCPPRHLSSRSEAPASSRNSSHF